MKVLRFEAKIQPSAMFVYLMGVANNSQVEKTADKLSVSRSGARRSYRPNRRLTRCGSAAAVLSG